jgi:hypothetical protein
MRMRFKRLLVSSAVGLSAFAVTGVTSANASINYTITNSQTGTSLGHQAPADGVIAYLGTGSPWAVNAVVTNTFAEIRVPGTNWCLDARTTGGMHNGETIQLYTCTGTNNQLWSFNAVGGKYQIIDEGDFRCLDHTQGTSNLVQGYDCNGQAQQLWSLH